MFANNYKIISIAIADTKMWWITKIFSDFAVLFIEYAR